MADFPLATASLKKISTGNRALRSAQAKDLGTAQSPFLAPPPASGTTAPPPIAPPPPSSPLPAASFSRPHAAPQEWAPPRPARQFSFGHPSFAPEWGRVTRGFDATPERREWQAEQILRRLGHWPPPEGEVYVIQIDQDSPPPPPPAPKPGLPAAEHRAQSETRRRAIEALNAYLTAFTGQTVAFRAERRDGRLKLTELNPNGPLRSASHPGQLDPAGQASCNGMICGMAWLRSGIYPYKTGLSGVFNPVQDSLMDVARDMNFDGAVDRRESALSARAHGFAIQIHAGFPGSPRSVGCQTMPPPDFAALQKIVADTGAPTFSYALVRRPNEIFGAQDW